MLLLCSSGHLRLPPPGGRLLPCCPWPDTGGSSWIVEGEIERGKIRLKERGNEGGGEEEDGFP